MSGNYIPFEENVSTVLLLIIFNAFYGMTVNYLDNNGEYECKCSTQ